MARFTTDFDETFTVPVPLQVACDYFRNVDRIAENLDRVEHVEKLDDSTLHVRMTPLARGPVTFCGEFRCRWDTPAENLLVWEPAGEGNVRMRGQARFSALGARATRVAFRQSIETEIEINRLLAMLATPIINGETLRMIRTYLERARQSLEALVG